MDSKQTNQTESKATTVIQCTGPAHMAHMKRVCEEHFMLTSVSGNLLFVDSDGVMLPEEATRAVVLWDKAYQAKAVR